MIFLSSFFISLPIIIMCLTPRTDSSSRLITDSDTDNYPNVQSPDWNCVPCCDYSNSPAPHANPGDLGIMHLNIRGLINKQDDLKKILTENDVDIAMLCEMWLNENNLSRVDILGYNIEYCSRKNKKGGGVAILLRKSLQYRLCNSLNLELEHLSVEAKTDYGVIIISSCYRPPNSPISNFLTEYDTLLKDLKECLKGNNSHLFIGLDHNLDLLKSKTHSPTNCFLGLNYNAGLEPSINKPTRITNSSTTLIDNVFISQNLEPRTNSNLLLDDISDHLPCLLTCQDVYPTAVHRLVKRRNLNKKAIELISEDLRVTNWHEKLQHLDCDSSFHAFHQIMITSLDNHAPVKESHARSKRNHLPWITKGIKRSISKQKLLYKISLETNNILGVEKYKNYRNSLAKLKRASKTLYYYSKCEKHKNNMKQLWQIINKISGKTTNKMNIVSCLTVEGIKTQEAKLICQTFAEKFSSVGKTYANKIKKPNKDPSYYMNKIKGTDKTMFFYPTNPHEIETLIDSLPNKLSSGHDDISNKLLKDVKASVVEPLSIIFNKSMNEGVFPSVMKKADVVPLHKGKDRTETNNYRPISLLLTLSKLLEKIVYKRTYTFLEANDLLYNSQYGFRSKHSCDNAVQELTSSILKNNENKLYTIGIFLDLSKAFDTISHNMLLQKLSLYGIRGIPHDWFQHYLKGRQMRVKCTAGDPSNLEYSDYYAVEYGTPKVAV